MAKKKRIILTGIALLGFLFVSVFLYQLFLGSGIPGITQDRNSGSPGMEAPTSPAAPAPSMPPMQEEGSDGKGIVDNGGSGAVDPEKTIGTYYFYLESKEFQTASNNILALVTKYNGYIENSNVYYGQYMENKKFRTGQYVFRIPKDSVAAFNNELRPMGNVVSETSSKQNISKSYTDTESRLKAVTVKEERILALYAKAEKIEDIIALENQLSQIFYEKEQLTQSLREMDDRIDYSYITVQLQEVDRLTTEETLETTFGERILNAIRDSFYVFARSLEKFAIWFIYALPFFVVFGLLGFFGFRFLKKRNFYRGPSDSSNKA